MIYAKIEAFLTARVLIAPINLQHTSFRCWGVEASSFQQPPVVPHSHSPILSHYQGPPSSRSLSPQLFHPLLPLLCSHFQTFLILFVLLLFKWPPGSMTLLMLRHATLSSELLHCNISSSLLHLFVKCILVSYGSFTQYHLCQLSMPCTENLCSTTTI